MKKSIFLVMFFTLLMVGSVSAAPNFVMIYEKAAVSAYIDQDSLTDNEGIINCWLKLNIHKETFVVNYLFNTKTQEMKAVKQRVYDTAGNLVKEETIEQAWEKVDGENKIIFDKIVEIVKK